MLHELLLSIPMLESRAHEIIIFASSFDLGL
jgi:hypothetical protein